MSWMETVGMDELERKRCAVVRHGEKQIVLWRVNGDVYASDNRCPHQGYPLSEGTLQAGSCVLTCNWHNWKFRLTDGENLTGEDRLQVYRTRIENGRVWVEIPEIVPEVVEARIRVQFEKAFRDQSYDRMARELARLHYNGSDPGALLRDALRWSHDRLEDGMPHAYAVLADWLTLRSELPDAERRLVCLLEAFDSLAEVSLRQPEYPYTRQRYPFTEEGFLQATESEDEETAVGMILHAIETQGLHFRELERALSHAALRHYQDFGHSVIYVLKAGQILGHLGAGAEPFVLPALVRSIVSAYREDMLPEFRGLGRHLDTWRSQEQNTAPDPEELFGRSVTFALDWVVRHSVDSSPGTLYEILLQTGARHLLHYDMTLQSRYDLPVSKNIGWLDFTHAVTFGNAVRRLCSMYPELWKYGLLQMACFAGRNRAFLNRTEEVSKWVVTDEPRFYTDCVERLLDHGQGLPIFSAHLVKTFVATREEAAVVSTACRKYLLAGLNRFLHSPIRQKHVRRTARQALELVGRDHPKQ